MATLYIHIGTPKTGTTAIQNFLLLNEQELRKHGVVHPHIEFEHMREKFRSRRNGNFLVYKSLLEGEEKEREEQQVYRYGFEVIKREAQTAEKIVISDEAIWYRQNSRESFWSDIRKDAEAAGCDLKVVVYLRRQDLLAQAEWNQSIKYETRSSSTFKKYLKSKALKRRNLDYYQALTDIAACIGKENLIVRVFQKDIFLRSQEGIYGDFLDAIGEKMREEYEIPLESQNERLDGNFVEIKRLINQIPEYKEMPTDFIYQPILRANSLKTPEKVSYFGYEEQVKFLRQFEDSNRRVAKEFLGLKDGVLFSDEVEKLPKWEIDQDTMYQDIIHLYAELAMEQHNRILALSERLTALEREVHNPLVHMAVIARKIAGKFARMFHLGDSNRQKE